MPRLSITNKQLGIEVVRMRKESREVANQLRRRVRSAASPLRFAIVTSALEFGLNRAAGAVSVRQSYSARSASIRVEINRRVAPYARPIDHGNGRVGGVRVNRHPVWGHGLREDWHWANQPVRPFFERGTARGGEAAAREIGRVLDDMVRAL